MQIQKKLVKGKSVSEISEELEEEEDVIAQMIREMGEERAADKHLTPKTFPLSLPDDDPVYTLKKVMEELEYTSKSKKYKSPVEDQVSKH